MLPDRRLAATEFEVRASASGKGVVVEGHGAVFNALSQNLGGFVERVDPGAFKKTLADNPDVRALINHDPMHILGRTRSATLRISTDSTGLAYEIDMPERQDARDLLVSMERGDITQSSFAFRVIPGGDEWDVTEDGFPLRILRAVSLHGGDVSPVTYPAYPDADSGIAERAYCSLAARLGVDPATVRAAAADNTLARVVRGETPDPADEPVVEEQRETHSETPAWFEAARRQYGG